MGADAKNGLEVVVEVAKRARVEAVARQVALGEQIKAIDAELERYDKIIQLANGQPAAQAKPKTKSKKRTPDMRVSEERLVQLQGVLATQPGMNFTKDQLVEATGWSKSSVTSALAVLDEQKRIVKARAPRAEGHVGQTAMLYSAAANGDSNGAEIHPDQTALEAVAEPHFP